MLTLLSQAVLGEGRQQQESQQQRRRRRILGRRGPETRRRPGAPHAPAGPARPARPEPAPAPLRRQPSFPRALGLRLLPSHGDASHIQAAASLRTAPGSPAFGAPVLTGHLWPRRGRRRAGAPGDATRSLVLPSPGRTPGAAASPVQGPGPHGAAAAAARSSHAACRGAPARPGSEGGRAPPGPPPRARSCNRGREAPGARAGGRGVPSGPSLPLPAAASPPRSPRPLAGARGPAAAPAPGPRALLQLRAAPH